MPPDDSRRYAAPIVDDTFLVDEYGEPAVRGQLLQLLGSGFGTDSHLATVTVRTERGDVRCVSDASVWTHALAQCTLDSPVRHGAVLVNVDGQASQEYLWRKDGATVHNATLRDGGMLDELPTEGGTVIAFAGLHFGAASSLHPIQASATYQAAEAGAPLYETGPCEVSEGYDRVECTTVPGIGQHHVWRLFVDGDIVGRAAVTCVGICG